MVSLYNDYNLALDGKADLLVRRIKKAKLLNGSGSSSLVDDYKFLTKLDKRESDIKQSSNIHFHLNTSKFGKYTLIIIILPIIIGALITVVVADYYYSLLNSKVDTNDVAENAEQIVPDRHISPAFIDDLYQKLPDDKKITVVISSPIGDAEAFQFADEIKNYLISENWSVEGVNRALRDEPFVGQRISQLSDDSWSIRIGAKE